MSMFALTDETGFRFKGETVGRINEESEHVMNGTLMAAILYVAYAVFLGRILWKTVLIVRSGPGEETGPHGRSGIALVKAGLDILFLTRLLRANALLWVWEWLFHACFVIVTLRHLRFFLQPVPRWIFALETPGYIAGWFLPFTLIIILIIKMREERRRYLLRYNFFLLAVIFLLGITGLMMRTVSPTDVVGIKIFLVDAMEFSVGPVPNGVFAVHLGLASVFLVFLPAHVFAAPYTLYEARKRDESIKRVMHE